MASQCVRCGNRGLENRGGAGPGSKMAGCRLLQSYRERHYWFGRDRGSKNSHLGALF